MYLVQVQADIQPENQLKTKQASNKQQAARKKKPHTILCK